MARTEVQAICAPRSKRHCNLYQTVISKVGMKMDIERNVNVHALVPALNKYKTNYEMNIHNFFMHYRHTQICIYMCVYVYK